MSNMLLCDTCVIIDDINGNSDRLNKLRMQGFDLYINAIIEMELLQGAHNRRELKKIQQQLNGFLRLELEQSIFDVATDWVRLYGLSHNLKAADAVIAATAITYDMPLLTYNLKDFRYLPGLQFAPL